MENNKHIKVARLFLASDAHILRGLLEAEDIEVFLFDEGVSSLEPAMSVASGGIKVHVPYRYKDDALRITEEFFDNMKIEDILKCPNCESENLEYDYKSQIKHFTVNFITMMSGTNASRGMYRYKHCLDCGYKF